MTHQIKSVTVGDNPFMYSIGIAPTIISFDVWVQTPTDQELYELSKNRDIQPIRIVAHTTKYSGFYYVRTGVGEEKGGPGVWVRTKIECYLYGTTGSHISSYSISDLDEVSNDWGI